MSRIDEGAKVRRRRGSVRSAAMSEQSRKIRVAVVYGGRSSEHGISVVSAGSVLARPGPGQVRGRAGRHHARRRRGCSPRPTRRGCRSPGARCPRSRRAPRSCCPATRRPTGLVVGRAGRGRARCSGRSTSCSRCCTAASARTARSRACSRWPACPTSGPGVLASAAAMDKEFTKKLLRADGLPVGRVRGGAPGQAVSVGRRASTRACRCSSSRRGPGRASASPR